DFTPAMLEWARQLAAERGVRNVIWDRGDAYSMPYAAGSFAVVVTRYSLHHILDPLLALQEMVRVCARDGRIVVVEAYAPKDPMRADAYNQMERLRDPSPARSLSLRELKGLFGRVGIAEPQITLYDLPVEVREGGHFGDPPAMRFEEYRQHDAISLAGLVAKR